MRGILITVPPRRRTFLDDADSRATRDIPAPDVERVVEVVAWALRLLLVVLQPLDGDAVDDVEKATDRKP